VVEFSDHWFAKTKFPIDMAGFVVNVDFLAFKLHQSIFYLFWYQENLFLQSVDGNLIDIELWYECSSRFFVLNTNMVAQKYVPEMKNCKFNCTKINCLVENLKQKVFDNWILERGKTTMLAGTSTDVECK